MQEAGRDQPESALCHLRSHSGRTHARRKLEKILHLPWLTLLAFVSAPARPPALSHLELQAVVHSHVLPPRQGQPGSDLHLAAATADDADAPTAAAADGARPLAATADAKTATPAPRQRRPSSAAAAAGLKPPSIAPCGAADDEALGNRAPRPVVCASPTRRPL